MRHILQLPGNSETDTVTYKALIPVHHDIANIDRIRAQATCGRKTKKEEKTLSINTTNTNSIKYNFFNIFVIYTMIIIILRVLLTFAVFFCIKKNDKRLHFSGNDRLVVNSNLFLSGITFILPICCLFYF